MTIESPKDVVIEGFNFSISPTATGSVVKVTIDSYASRNSIAAIKAIADENAATQQRIIENGKNVLGFMIEHAK